MDDNNLVIYRNRVEMKILGIVYMIVGIPSFITILVTSFNNPSNLVVLIVFAIFCVPLYLVSRYKIVFDTKKGIVIHTGYFSSNKIYEMSRISIRYEKGKSTLYGDYTYSFFVHGYLAFKINSIDFQSQTKKSINILTDIFPIENNMIWNIENHIKIKDGYLAIISYEIDEDIAIIYLSNNISIDLGYVEFEKMFYLTVYEENNWNNQKEVVSIADEKQVFEILQKLINKYEEFDI